MTPSSVAPSSEKPSNGNLSLSFSLKVVNLDSVLLTILFCSHILLCNVLTTILRPNFEEPIDTAKQMVEKNITIVATPGNDIWKKFLLNSAVPAYQTLGENLIVADSWEQDYNLSTQGILDAGTHARMEGYLVPYYLIMGRWYRSKEKVAGVNPYGGYLTNKKWHLKEVKVKED